MLRRLVEECLERFEDEGRAAVDAVCEEHPEHAARIRSRLDTLQQVGLLGTDLDEGDEIPEQLGEFRLLRVLGSGGMGIVYLAEQESLGREVALKLIRPEHLFFPGTRDRFQREAEAIARLEHPGIVRILSFGVESGVPYFAMEFVRGASLADVIRDLQGQDPATLRGRDLQRVVDERAAGLDPWTAGETDAELWQGGWVQTCFRLARAVAEALDHAHARGVLHRDVKPSNVIVTRTGRVLLLDFGLARSGGRSSLTRSGALVGSLPYMAPEQVRGEIDRVGPRTDVYGLGVTLYELLSLREPFVGETAEHTRDRILAGKPAPLAQCNSAVARDAETLCLAAMAAEPSRRYESAAAFAADLRNYLELRPITAQRPGPWLRLRKAAQRHPARPVLAVLMLLAAVLGAVGLRLRRRADVNLDEAMHRVERLVALVGETDLANLPHTDQRRREVLEDALRFYELFGRQRGEDATLREATGGKLADLGRILHRFGEHEKAEHALVRAADLLGKLHAEHPDRAGIRDKLAYALTFLGNLRFTQNQGAEAEQAWSAAADHLGKLAADFPANPGFRGRLASVHRTRARLEIVLGRRRRARRMLAAVLRMQKALLDEDPDNPTYRAEVARTQHALGYVLALTGAGSRAGACFLRALAMQEEVVRRRPGSADARKELATYHAALAQHWQASGDKEKAEGPGRRALELRRDLAARYPQRLDYVADYLVSLAETANLLCELGRLGEAEALARTATERGEDLHRRHPGLQRVKLAIAWGTLGQTLAAERKDGAGAAFRRAVEVAGEVAQRYPGRPSIHAILGGYRRALGGLVLDGGDVADARAIVEQAVRDHRRSLELGPGTPPYTAGLGDALILLARILVAANDHDAAMRCLEEVLDDLGFRRQQVAGVPGLEALEDRADYRALLRRAGGR